ncbi:hypothetical protein HG530_006747 [Fusarium avenaceum]|nr:hypothetical protein HG530_006747 [Fusarium avenaceum]
MNWNIAPPLSSRNISTTGSAGGASGTIPSALGLHDRTIRVDALINIPNTESKTGRVNVAMTPKKQGTKHGLGKDVQNAVEDGFRVGRNKIASLADTPGNGVENPENSCQRATCEECSANIRSNVVCVDSSLPSKLEDDCANKTSNNHDPVNKNNPENSGPRHASGEEEIHEEKGSGDEPIDVSHVKDLTVDTRNAMVAALVLNSNGRPSQVGSHGEYANIIATNAPKKAWNKNLLRNNLAASNANRNTCARMCAGTGEVEVLVLGVLSSRAESEDIHDGMAQTQNGTLVKVELLLPCERSVDDLVLDERSQINTYSSAHSLDNSIASKRNHLLPVLTRGLLVLIRKEDVVGVEFWDDLGG